MFRWGRLWTRNRKQERTIYKSFDVVWYRAIEQQHLSFREVEGLICSMHPDAAVVCTDILPGFKCISIRVPDFIAVRLIRKSGYWASFFRLTPVCHAAVRCRPKIIKMPASSGGC